MAGLTNPTEYNDGAFMDASNDFQGGLAEGLDKLWEAGASLGNIEAELADAIENTDFGRAHLSNIRVSINYDGKDD